MATQSARNSRPIAKRHYFHKSKQRVRDKAPDRQTFDGNRFSAWNRSRGTFEEDSRLRVWGEVITRTSIETERYRRLPNDVLETIHANSLRRFEVARKKLRDASNAGREISRADVLQIRKKVCDDALRTLRASARVLKERKLNKWNCRSEEIQFLHY